jgi:hypothetical protein
MGAITQIAQPDDGWTLFYLSDKLAFDKVSVSVKNPGDYTLQSWKDEGLQSDWANLTTATATTPGTLEFDFHPIMMTNRFRVLSVSPAADDEITAFSAHVADE